MRIRTQLVLSWVIALAAAAAAQTPAPPAFGAPSSGLRIGISQDRSRSSDPTALEVHFHNVGDTSFMLNLGVMLDTGRVMEPRFLSVSVTDESGVSRTLQWFRPLLVAGRLDDYPVALRAGATYSLPVTITEFSDDRLQDPPLPLTPWRYRIEVQFQGRGPHSWRGNLELLPWWTGKAVSGTLELLVKR